MPKKTVDTAGAKARKQKMILAVGGVLLIGLAAFQGPKLMHRSGTQPSAPLTSSTASSPDSNGIEASAAAPATPAPAAAVVTGKPGAVVAGVAFPGRRATEAGENQLISFTLFKAKDPFVPKVGDAQSSSPAPGPTTTGQSAPPAGAAAPTTSDTARPSAPPAPIAFATITLNGAPQQVEVKNRFPEKSPLFVLHSLAKREAKIAVAGGSFDDGQTVKLPFGKTITLLNTATGVRYELKLVYTGSAPEVIEGFTTDKQASTDGSSTGSTDTGSTDATTVDSAAGANQPSSG
jgi:hypothetical protein